jgi:nucleoid DNA-binding protein
MAKKKTKKAAPAKKPMTKSEILTSLAESSGLSKKEVAGVFENLGSLIGKNLSKRGAGMFTIPGLMKVKVVRKPATKARKGINPFTKEETIFKAKPARNVVKILPLKGLKDMV